MSTISSIAPPSPYRLKVEPLRRAVSSNLISKGLSLKVEPLRRNLWMVQVVWKGALVNPAHHSRLRPWIILKLVVRNVAILVTHQTVLHVALRNQKIWTVEDWTEDGIATHFLKDGVPPDDMVLGFQPPMMRPYTEFAVA